MMPPQTAAYRQRLAAALTVDVKQAAERECVKAALRASGPAEQWTAAGHAAWLATLVDAIVISEGPTLAPLAWRCKACGCWWRDNQNGTLSLFGPEHKSCQVCERGNTYEVCEPLSDRVVALDYQSRVLAYVSGVHR